LRYAQRVANGAPICALNRAVDGDNLAAVLNRNVPKARRDRFESSSRFRSLIEHDLFGKSLHTFPNHAPSMSSTNGLPLHGQISQNLATGPPAPSDAAAAMRAAVERRLFVAVSEFSSFRVFKGKALAS
jgi:hypothetical protein